ncbi:MAG: hypothetical protein ABSG78_03165 [Verrucomicrobiota bacterium]|jgi:hypothetical protein
MKAPKILMAGLLAFSLAGAAHAQTIIHITGSTAFRAGAHQAITDILDPNSTPAPVIAWTGSSLPSASQAIFTGKTYASNGAVPVIIKTSWSGSLGGIQTVSENLTISTWLTNTTPAGAGAVASGNNVDPPAVPDACFSDGFQASSPFTSPVLLDHIVGIVPFKWVRNNGSPATLSNMTPQLAVSLYTGSGSLPLALFTGLNSDEGTNVYALGRNADSGTRLNAFAETGVGVLNLVHQYYPLHNATIISKSAFGSVTGQELVPQDTVNGIVYPKGDSGYNSGGDLAFAIQATGSATATGVNGFYVTYLGLPDAFTAEGGGGVDMTYNGIPYSPTAVEEGQYTFWGYEHVMYRQNYGGLQQTVTDLISAKILNQDAAVIPSGSVAPGILLGSMHVQRFTDGGPISNNY